MNKFVRKAKAVGEVFIEGALAQLADPGTLSIAATVGLFQGLKYNGNLVRGIKGGTATLGVLAAVNGIRCIFKNIDYIKQVGNVEIGD